MIEVVELTDKAISGWLERYMELVNVQQQRQELDKRRFSDFDD